MKIFTFAYACLFSFITFAADIYPAFLSEQAVVQKTNECEQKLVRNYENMVHQVLASKNINLDLKETSETDFIEDLSQTQLDKTHFFESHYHVSINSGALADLRAEYKIFKTTLLIEDIEKEIIPEVRDPLGNIISSKKQKTITKRAFNFYSHLRGIDFEPTVINGNRDEAYISNYPSLVNTSNDYVVGHIFSTDTLTTKEKKELAENIQRETRSYNRFYIENKMLDELLSEKLTCYDFVELPEIVTIEEI